MNRNVLLQTAVKWKNVHDLLNTGASDGDVSDAVRSIYPWYASPSVVTPSTPSTPPTPPSVETHPKLPRKIIDTLDVMLKLSPEQIDTIMTCVSLPENGSSRWWEFYNYIEFGDDSALRGYTTTIFGATTGTGSLLKVFDALATIDPRHPLLKYHAALRQAKGGVIKGLEGLAHVNGDPTKAKAKYDAYTQDGRTHLDHIQGDLATLSNTDVSWQLAVWHAFVELNWKSAADFCAKTNEYASRPGPVLTTPLAKGFIVDTSLNHGDARYWKDADTWKVIWKKMKNPQETNETVWLRYFIRARQSVLSSGYAGLDWSKTGNRCLIWLDLLKKKNVTLKRPIQVVNSTAKPYPIWTNGLVIT
jgi:hypothetical protein